MKRAAIIFLALIVWFFLVPGAFAGQYVVILLEVDSGFVRDVYEADVLGSQDPNHPSNPRAIILRGLKANPHLDDSGNPAPVPVIINEGCIETKFAVQSPGCRYIWHPAGYWVKVCN